MMRIANHCTYAEQACCLQIGHLVNDFDRLLVSIPKLTLARNEELFKFFGAQDSSSPKLSLPSGQKVM